MPTDDFYLKLVPILSALYKELATLQKEASKINERIINVSNEIQVLQEARKIKSEEQENK